jgi:hypothetical protein
MIGTQYMCRDVNRRSTGTRPVEAQTQAWLTTLEQNRRPTDTRSVEARQVAESRCARLYP